jgi:hypothetical protein
MTHTWTDGKTSIQEFDGDSTPRTIQLKGEGEYTFDKYQFAK